MKKRRVHHKKYAHGSCFVGMVRALSAWFVLCRHGSCFVDMVRALSTWFVLCRHVSCFVDMVRAMSTWFVLCRPLVSSGTDQFHRHLSELRHLPGAIFWSPVCLPQRQWRHTDEHRYIYHIDGLMQDCSISSALAMEILQSCTKPST